MRINAPSRLHIALIDLNGSYQRMDGGIGLTLDSPNFILSAEETDKGITIDFDKSIHSDSIKNAVLSKVQSAAEKMTEHYKIENGYHFTVENAYPAHSGLGSGTQASLSAAKLIAESIGEKLSSVQLSSIVGRGGTSGIGTHAFDLGGFIADGGHTFKEKSTFIPSSASDALPPVLIGRYEFPKDWEILLATPDMGTFVTGRAELNFFQKYCPLPKNEVEQTSHIIFMNMIPFLIEKDIEEFGKSLDMIQTKGFCKVEINHLQPPEVKKLMNDMRDAGAYGVGLSSLGPTVFTVFDKKNESIVKSVEELVGDKGMIIRTKARNSGAVITK